MDFVYGWDKKKTSEFKIKAISKLPRYYQDDC